jgi:hypothetical protein
MPKGEEILGLLAGTTGREKSEMGVGAEGWSRRGGGARQEDLKGVRGGVHRGLTTGRGRLIMILGMVVTVMHHILNQG